MEIIKIKLSLSNAYLVKDKKSILVDTGSHNESGRILAALEKAGVNQKDISLILHTHGHVDHAGSTAELKRRLGVPTAVHHADAFMLRTGTNGIVKPRNLEASLIKFFVIKPFEPSAPDMILEHEMDLGDFGVDGRVIFTPGHTRGSLSVILGNREAIVGDIMMGGVMGGNLFGSRPNYHYFIDDLDALHSSIQKVLDCNPSKLYVGHGGPLSTGDVTRHFETILERKIHHAAS